MRPQRIKEYVRLAVFENGSVRKDICTFNEAQAGSVNAVLTDKGIVIHRANVLIERWNELGRKCLDPKYYYCLNGEK